MTSAIRAVVVDDEPLARRGITARLKRSAGIDVVRECASGREAVKAIRDEQPDLVFLDVQMPGVNGFGVIEQIGPDLMPPTVFVTAYDEHALKAFDAQALDYLLKPIDDERFERSLERARRRIAERRQSTARGSRLLIKERGRVQFVDAAEIDWVEARGDYVRLHTAGRTHLLRETMSEMERSLNSGAFIRIHRSTLVNAERVCRLLSVAPREWQVELRDGTRLKMSRRYRTAVEAQLRGKD
jgi:two-component system LytT family response regulator